MIRQRITFATPNADNAAVHYRHQPGDPRQIIESLRSIRGFKSTRALALAAGINQPTLHRYLAGTSETMEVASFMALAQTLGVTVSELLGEVPLSNSGTAREVSRIMARMTPAQQIKFLRVGEALADDEPPKKTGD